MIGESKIREAADVETSSQAYAARFAGATGSWLLSKQTQIVLDMLRQVQAKTVLDVAGGHGQLAHPLSEHGYKITVTGSAASCDLQVKDLVAQGKCNFQVGSFQEMNFESHSFDTVTCFRYLSHCSTWPKVIAEMCRVAKSAVIVDYPPLCSFNFLNPLFFKLKRKLEGNTRTFRIFKDSEINQIFISHGFVPAQRSAQFFFPMVVHRVMAKPALSSILEKPVQTLGLTQVFGSPVVAMYVRQT